MRRSTFSSLALLLAIATPVAAQSTGGIDPAVEVAAQLSQLNATLMEVQALLERQLETQTLDLVLKRSQLASAEVGRLDAQLRRAVERRDSLEEEQVHLEVRAENLEDAYRRSSEDGPSMQEVEMMQRNVRIQRALIEERLSNIAAEVVDLENRLERKREDLQSWQELLDRRLAGM